MTLAIRTEALTRRFGRHLAVDSVNLEVPQYSVYGFLGRNGAGKTTTLKLLLGLLKPDSGRALIGGVDVQQQRLVAARHVGALLEAHGFYANLSGRDNLDLCRRLRGCPESEIHRVLEIVEMREHAQRPVGKYSLGMHQRLGLARALLGAPSVLILDEPANGLDPEGIADMRRLLRQLPERAQATVLVSSHQLGEVEQTASHIGILSRGRLIVQGALESLHAELGTQVQIDTDNIPATLSILIEHAIKAERGGNGLTAHLPSRADIPGTIAGVTHALCQAGIGVHAITPHAPSLENLYRQASAGLEAAA